MACRKKASKQKATERKYQRSSTLRSSPITDEKITNFFALRKRKSDDCYLGPKTDVDVLGKRLRKDVNISESKSCMAEYVPNVSSAVSEGTPLGIFGNLPHLVFDSFIDNASVSVLIRLAQTSFECSMRILSFLQRPIGVQRFVRETNATSSGFSRNDNFHLFGQILKATTCLLSTEERVVHLKKFYDKASMEVTDMSGWGRLFISMSSKWTFQECLRIVEVVLKMDDARIMNGIANVTDVEVNAGSNLGLEMQVRKWLRQLFFDQPFTDEDESSFWIAAILKKLPTHAEQARLLMVLYAPTHFVNGIEVVDWRSLVDDVVRSEKDSAKRLKPLANALLLLHGARKLTVPSLAFSNHDCFNLIEEITTCPEPWSFDNFVALLLHDRSLIHIALSARMTHGHEEEAGSIISTMKTLLFRWGHSLGGTLKDVVTSTMKQMRLDLRRKLFAEIYTAYARNVKELVYASRSETQEELKAQLEFAPLLQEITMLL